MLSIELKLQAGLATLLEINKLSDISAAGTGTAGQGPDSLAQQRGTLKPANKSSNGRTQTIQSIINLIKILSNLTIKSLTAAPTSAKKSATEMATKSNFKRAMPQAPRPAQPSMLASLRTTQMVDDSKAILPAGMSPM